VWIIKQGSGAHLSMCVVIEHRRATKHTIASDWVQHRNIVTHTRVCVWPKSSLCFAEEQQQEGVQGHDLLNSADARDAFHGGRHSLPCILVRSHFAGYYQLPLLNISGEESENVHEQ